MEGHFISCGYCHTQFFICRHCYRGHRYCSSPCRKLGYEIRRRLARKKYAASAEARVDHRDRNNLYRVYGPIGFVVMDKTYAPDGKLVNPSAQKKGPGSQRCICCGSTPLGDEIAGHKISLLLQD